LTTATASVTSTVDSVTALAMSDTQGLSIGPLTIGEIRSTASQTFGGDGRVTPSSSLEITGIKLGTLPVSFTRDGVLVGASHTPVPVNETMAKLLAPSRITFRVLAAQEVPGRVVAPTVQITAPLASPAADGDPTTLTIVLGGATAALTATRDNPAVQADTPVGQTPGAPSLEPSTRVLAPVNPSVSAVDQLVAPLTEGAIVGYPVLASPAFGAGGSPLPARRPGLRRTSIATHQTPLAFDFNPLYVVFAIGAFAVLIPALVVRRVGTRP
jgi:hypothetical protein